MCVWVTFLYGVSGFLCSKDVAIELFRESSLLLWVHMAAATQTVKAEEGISTPEELVERVSG